MQGTFFVVSVFLQQIRGYNAIQTGLMLTPSTIGVLAASAAAGRLARKRSQELLIRAGFVTTAVGIALLMALVREQSGIWTFVPGLLLIGLGVGVMLTSSVNVVQSAFPEKDQGDISGLSRSVSNLGSSLGTALAGSVLVGASVPAASRSPWRWPRWASSSCSGSWRPSSSPPGRRRSPRRRARCGPRRRRDETRVRGGPR